MNDRQALLRNSLRGNAAFSTLSGTLFLLFAGPLSEAIGLADSRVVGSVGLNLLGFAALLLFLASRETLHLGAATTVVFLDLAWVVGTVPVVALDLLNRTGAIAAVAIADVVLVFALLQYLGVRRIRGAPHRRGPVRGAGRGSPADLQAR